MSNLIKISPYMIKKIINTSPEPFFELTGTLFGTFTKIPIEHCLIQRNFLIYRDWSYISLGRSYRRVHFSNIWGLKPLYKCLIEEIKEMKKQQEEDEKRMWEDA